MNRRNRNNGRRNNGNEPDPERNGGNGDQVVPDEFIGSDVASGRRNTLNEVGLHTRVRLELDMYGNIIGNITVVTTFHEK